MIKDFCNHTEHRNFLPEFFKDAENYETKYKENRKQKTTLRTCNISAPSVPQNNTKTEHIPNKIFLTNSNQLMVTFLDINSLI